MALIGLSHYIWDEPLNDADIYTRMQLEELLLTHRPTMVFVEHDQAFTDKVATKGSSCKEERIWSWRR